MTIQPNTPEERAMYEARAERLAGALEDIRSRSAMNSAMRPNPFALTAELGNIHQIADAAMRKEGRNG